MADGVQHRKIEGHTLYSAHLQEERNLKVFLPPDYDEGRRYPVLYCHDGLEFFTHGRIATIAHEMILAGRLHPLIIVGIAVSRTHRTDDYALSGNRHEAYRQFVVDECLPYIHAHYAEDESQRDMAGISLGAVATLSLFLHHPGIFRNLMLFSGAYYEDVRAFVQSFGSLSQFHGYLAIGRQETAVETPHGSFDFYRYHLQMRDILRIRGAKIEVQEADGTHIWGLWQRLLPDALVWLRAQQA